jgi:hypothetical protein
VYAQAVFGYQGINLFESYGPLFHVSSIEIVILL